MVINRDQLLLNYEPLTRVAQSCIRGVRLDDLCHKCDREYCGLHAVRM